jgi:hypothetical protein
MATIFRCIQIQIKSYSNSRFLYQGEKRQVYSQQGLTVKKNKQNVDAIINEDFFNQTDEQSNTDENAQ